LLLLTPPFANAQTADPKLTFEVASVKPAAPLDAGGRSGRPIPTGGGAGISNPGLFDRRNATLSILIMQAYGLKAYQVTGPPWLTTERYDVRAKVPEGATEEQQLAMLRNLLAQRFGLAVHRETKEVPVYDLVIAKGGQKFKEYVPPPPEEGDRPPAPRSKFATDPDGFPVPPATGGMVMIIGKGAMMTAMHENCTMETLIVRLGGSVDHPVFDRTGLKETYDITLRWVLDRAAFAMPAEGSPDTGPPVGPDIYMALQSQLGLKLEPAKGMVEVMVVDHAAKVPTEN
jgi:uncharacterized protein (TIGR03435 family)